MVVAVRQYGRWLNDNYADLENKKVWLCQTVSLVCMLLFVLYVLAIDMVLIWLIHIIELILVGLLLWRVETLPRLQTLPHPLPIMEGSGQTQGNGPFTSLNSCHAQTVVPVNIDLAEIEQMLVEHCANTQLYLKHDLNLAQLAQAVGTNRYYLSQYFSRKGITYNIYINNQRINHFISRYNELTAAGQPIVAQQLAIESGYHSYSTFSLAFKQRTGQSVTAWMRESDE
jgi:AraC-like DNA-binding protein